MRKTFTLLTAMLAFAAVGVSASAQVIHGEMTGAMGWVRQPDGTKKFVKGMKFPYTLTPVKAKKMTPVRRAMSLRPKFGRWLNAFVPPENRGGPPSGDGDGGGGGGIGPDADTRIYYALNPGHPFVLDGYAYLDPEEFFDPSSLDDIVINPAGSGKIWTKMSFGLHVEGSAGQTTLFRFRIFNTHQSNPPGQMDFSDELADFGNFMSVPPPGDYVMDLNPAGVQQAGVNVPDTDCWMAVQWRQPTFPLGEGAFMVDLYNLYYAENVPSVGSSQDTFYFDWDPRDGIYEDTEIDQFEPPAHANLALSMNVDTSGTTTTVTPDIVQTTHGTYQSGNHISLRFEDANVYSVLESLIGARTDPNVGVTVTAFGPTQNPLSLRVKTIATTQNQKAVQKLEIWRYGGTPGWVTLDSRQTTAGVPLTVDALYGGSIPLPQFVGPSGEVKCRLWYFRDPVGSRTPMTTQINLVNWIIGH